MNNKEDTAKSVGHIPSGLFIVCTGGGDGRKQDGFLGSWIQQVSFDPLLISLCIKPGRPAADEILDGRVFTVNTVGDHDKRYLKHFWSGHNPEKNPFEEIPHSVTPEGGLVIDAAKSAVICKKIASSMPGDHHLVVAQVLRGVLRTEDSKSAVHLRKSGLDY